MWGPWVQECGQLLEAEKGKKGDFPLKPSKEMQPSYSRIMTIENYKAVHLGKAARFMVICYSSNRKWIRISSLTRTSIPSANPGWERPRRSSNRLIQEILKWFVKSWLIQWQPLIICRRATLPTATASSKQRPARGARRTSATQVFTALQIWASNQVWAGHPTACGHRYPLCHLHTLYGAFCRRV